MSYDTTILADGPVLFLSDGTTTNHGSNSYSITNKNGVTTAPLPNGDNAFHFDSSGKQFISVADPSDGSLSINKTGGLTVEFWMQLDAVNQPHPGSGLSGGVDLIGKAEDSGPGCEYEFRYYNQNSSDSGNTPQNCCFYAYSPSCGYGAGFDDHIDSKSTSQWFYFCGTYSTSGSGDVSIFAGILGNSKYVGQKLNSTTMVDSVQGAKINPGHTPAPFNIGYCDDCYFYGKLGKVAVYDKVLSASQISAHFKAMTSGPPQPPTVPGVPTNVKATAGNAQATVTWTASTGSPTNYAVTSSPGNVKANSTSTTATVAGLTNGTAYTFTVTATNSAGTSAASTASNSVTPSGTTPPSGTTGFAAPVPTKTSYTRSGGVLTATAVFTNATAHSMTLQWAGITSRPPGGTHHGGPFDVLSPADTNVVVAAGKTLSVTASRSFRSTDKLGTWEVYATYQGAAGAWHDGPSTYVTVT